VRAACDTVAVIVWPADGAALDQTVRAIGRVASHSGIPAAVYLVDDGADERIASIAARTGASILISRSRDYGDVIAAGVDAIGEAYIVTLDGSGAHPPDLLSSLCAMRRQADLVIASRYVPGGFDEMGMWRRLVSRSLNAAFRRLLSLPIHDLSSSYRLYRRDLLVRLAPKMTTDAALQEILVRTYCEGYAIAEVPWHYVRVTERDRGVGKLTHLALDYVSTFRAMWALRNSIDSCDYDSRAFFSRIPLQRWWQRKRCRILASHASGRLRVLDAGCGSTQLLNRVPLAIGMDYSLRKLRFMRRPGRRLVNGSTFDLPFRSGAFDVVISSQVVEHLRADPKVFAELARCVAPGGTLVVGTVDYGTWRWPVIERLYDWFKPTGYAQEHITHYTRRTLIEQLRANGLQIDQCEDICGAEIIVTATKLELPEIERVREAVTAVAVDERVGSLIR